MASGKLNVGRKLQENSVWRVSFVAAFFVVSLFVTSFARAALITPAGLNPGEKYHLAFVTSTTQDATSSDIEDYNDFVQAAADAAMIGSIAGGNTSDVEWFAIGSTVAVDARDNAVVSAPVYLLDGTTKVADGFTDLWGGSLDSPLNISELLQTDLSELVWTGSKFDGTEDVSKALGTPSVTFGDTGATGFLWLRTSFDTNPENLRSMYALSEELTVPSQTIPEPSTFGLGIVALTGLIAFQWRRRRKR